jgi:MraZ protein
VNGFLSRYEHQMDDKGRVSLPSAYRREAEGGAFVLLQWEKPYLTLFPHDVWAEIQQRLMDFRKQDPQSWHHVRRILAEAVEVSLDSKDRILIPSWLQEAASLEGTVLLNGNIDRVELWNPEIYAETVEKAAPPDELAAVRHRLFG